MSNPFPGRTVLSDVANLNCWKKVEVLISGQDVREIEMKRPHTNLFWGGLLMIVSCSPRPDGSAIQQPSRLEAVSFAAVRIDDSFWRPRIETNRTVTIPANFQKSEETGRISNFARAGGLEEGPHQGRRYDDSDVFKIIEGASYSLSQTPDPDLDSYLDGLIAKIGAAQEEDGYLYTIRTLGDAKEHPHAGDERWAYLVHSHELYNVGHMYEAAVAHHRATGKRALLDVAIKNADLMVAEFGPGRNYDVPGHEEIEIGLAKLYQVTGKREYLDLAKFFVDQRGRHENRTEGGVLGPDDYGGSPEYAQDHLPVVEQTEAVGHSVRALYLYSGVADVAALSEDMSYLAALDRLWRNLVHEKTYLTGGLGSSREGESFGPAFALENTTAYNETCAAIASILWNHRLFLLHGDAAYLDVLERSLYNGALSGVSLRGDTFFYPNPLASDGKTAFNQGSATRAPWFATSCCPTNISRFLPSVSGYLYATKGADLYVNLFAGNRAEIETASNRVAITQVTDYPWDGDVTITLKPERAEEFTVYVRIPGWARNEPLAGGLYSYLGDSPGSASIEVNGDSVPVRMERGFARVRRHWRAGDTIRVELPIAVRRVKSRPEVKPNAGLVAIERGPLVYCVEGVDHGGSIDGVHVAPDAKFAVNRRNDLLGGVDAIDWDGFTAVPYYSWSNRGIGPMAVWLPAKP